MRQHKPPAQARQRQGTTAGTTWEPRTIWERPPADRECRRKKSTAIRYVNCAVARSRSSDDAPELGSHSRLRLFSSDCCRSCFVWRRLRIVGQALPSRSCSNSAFGSGADDRAAQVRLSLRRDHCWSCRRRAAAGTSTKRREEHRRIAGRNFQVES
jgi:hypothetical protein